MRQRFLLVAGWAAAATVAIVVSSGAVSVAGGQVSDRPLRALSASEVAALPVAYGSERPAVSEPLASGGSDSTGTSAADEATEGEAPTSAPRPIGKGEDAPGFEFTAPTYPPFQPSGAVVDSSDPGIIITIRPAPESIAPETPRPVARIADLRGGRVAYRGDDGRVSHLWSVGKPGYGSVLETSEDQTVMTVTFSNGRRESTLIVAWTEEGLAAVEFEDD